MKFSFKSFLLLLAVLSVFASCQSLEVMHYKYKDFDKVSDKLDNYDVYIHNETTTYKVEKPKVSVVGIKGVVTEIRDPATIAEIKNPQTKSQLRKHKHDLSIYTKADLNTELNATILKNVDMTSYTIIIPKSSGFDASTMGQILGVAAYGTLVGIAVVYAFEGKL
ncbi:MAG TPA: hypothetical protein VK809_01105 [Bacteroidia bacterium]|jgi:hypothetical protein|nr:hypothetical protein [Bacteroidia bacterium]